MTKGAGEYCTYCTREMVPYTATHPTRDHVMPKSKGGRKTVWCCTKCNNAKGDMLPEEWQRFMREFPEWWEVPGREAAGRRSIFEARKFGASPKSVPQEYDNAQQQTAFENVYRNRLHMLR